jgi:murein L,D-transpeptidase YcbB/YkuD
MGDVLTVLVPALILAAALWAFATALKPRDGGMSDADRYQLDLARRSQAHYAAQVQAAMAARARMEAAALPSQNRQQQIQHHELLLQHGPAALGHPGHDPGRHPDNPQRPDLAALLAGTTLNPQLALQLQALVRNGQKLQAIRLLRQATHSDLLTAKQFVDRL